MKYYILSLCLMILVGCKDVITTDVYIFNNTTNHYIELEFFARDQNTSNTVIKLKKNSTDNTLETYGRGVAEFLTEVYDSVLVNYDDTVSIIHVRKAGPYPDYFENHILDRNSWIEIQLMEENKHSYRRDILFSFTEQDYLDAL